MPEEFKPGCARPMGETADTGATPPVTAEQITMKKEETAMIQVGKRAPDFTAPAFHQGKFVNIKLSEFAGKWVLLCFYPGDFTFV